MKPSPLRLLPLLLLMLLPGHPPPVRAATTAAVVFPSGEEFLPLDDQSPAGCEDPEDTGSLAFARRPENARLARGLTLTDWCCGQPCRTFRAHPDLIACLADINSDLQRGNDGSQDRLKLVRGFVSLADSGGSLAKPPPFPLNYHAAGTAAEIGLRSGAAGVQRRLSAAFARTCATPLIAAGWDFGLVAGPAPGGSLLILLQSRRRPAALMFRAVASPEFADSPALEAWTREQWELGFLAAGINATAELQACPPGQAPPHPFNGRPEADVGPADELATPPDSPDYQRLMQYPASGLLEFPGCPKLLGSWRGVKCPSRLMSARMLDSVRRLHALAASGLPGWRLRVAAGWEAPDEGHPSLRSEGRQLELTPIQPGTGTSQTLDNLEAAILLANTAACAGFDFVGVDNATDPASPRVTLAVIKQARPRRLQAGGSGRPAVLFQQAGHLTPVEPPSRLAGQYGVTGMDDAALEERPLFDGALDPAAPLGSHARRGMFVSRSREFRYFRLHPALTSCYDSLVELANRGGGGGGGFVGIAVLRSYLTELEERALLEPASDPRVGGHPEGVAMHLAYSPDSPGYRPDRHTVWHLAEAVASACAPKFHEQRSLFGIGVYSDGVYVDIRPVAKVWLECERETSQFTNCPLSPPPSAVTVGGLRATSSASGDFKVYLLEKALQAVHGRVVEPLSGSVNCEFDRPPQAQHPGFVYRPKKQRPLPEDDEEAGSKTANQSPFDVSQGCQSGDASEFCRKSAATRETLVGHVWSDVSVKHLPAGSDRVRQALETCLLSCASAGCVQDSNRQWQEKLAACENLAHWLPFDLENDVDGRVSNLYSPGDADLRRLACYSGEHCVDWSPLFSLLNPTLSAWFRLKPDGPGKEGLFDPEGNPSPLLGIVRRLYGQYARGDVKVWVRDETDIKILLDELKVLFLYNNLVTSVTVMVLDGRSVNSVASQLEGEFGDWLQQACPESSRSYLTPHRVMAFQGQQVTATAFAASSEADVVHRGLHPPMDSIDLRNW